jgi:cysteine desulfurase/selenocysteine lyase
MFDVQKIREQFPILNTQVHGKPLVYLDNAATTQKPLCVLNASRDYYEHCNANVHRGAHYLSQIATQHHEDARVKAASFIGASRPEEFLFTSGCTMGINLVANVLGFSGLIGRGDEIILSATEHHSNIVPWQMLAERCGAVIRYIPLNEDEQWDMDAYANLLSPKTRIVSLGHVSNALGLVNPVQQAIAMAKANRSDTLAIVDGAQSITHMPINVQELGCDFFAFSGHKLYAPTGTGGLWGRYELLDMLPPWMGGGEMIQEVTFEKTTYNKPPFKYEAGTPNIEGAIAMAQAMDFVNSVGFDDIEAHEHELMTLALDGLSSMPKVRILGKNAPRGAVISILVDGIHHYDLGTLVDQMGIAVRTGHHCCQPLMSVLGTTGTLRISFALYNTKEEVAVALKALDSAISMLS